MTHHGWCATALVLLLALPAPAAEPLDRILARVNGQVVLLSDAQAARVLGLAGLPPQGELSAAAHALVDRQLMVAEAMRGLPEAPDAARVEKEVAAMTARVGGPSRLSPVMAETGVTVEHLRRLARESLWIDAYLQQRFADGLTSDAGQAWLGDLRRRASITCGVPGC